MSRATESIVNPTTRLAPSPTGALHLGNARSFLMTWLLARQRGWRIAMRIEDLDGPRVRKGAADGAIGDLSWLGLDWDSAPVFQSRRGGAYSRAIEALLSAGSAYYCICTRSDIAQASSAPHADDGAVIYPGTCRGKFTSRAEALAASGGAAPAIRFKASDVIIRFEDLFRGSQQFNVARQLGDFVIAKADGSAAYQLAVVVDDADAGVTHVVRGDDLLDSAPRQILLYRALGLEAKVPRYCHIPLVVGTDGRRLAKRHGDTRLEFYRQAGVSAGRVRALLARWCGIAPVGKEISIQELLERFDLNAAPKERVVYSDVDDGWLRG